MSMEMAGEELVGSEVTEVGGIAEVGNGGDAHAMLTGDTHHTDIHHQLPVSVNCESAHFSNVIQTGETALIQEVDPNIQDQIPTLLETADTGPLVGAEETTTVSSQTVVGAATASAVAPKCPQVTSVLQKKVTNINVCNT